MKRRLPHRSSARALGLGLTVLSLCACHQFRPEAATVEPATVEGKGTPVVTEPQVTQPLDSQGVSAPTLEIASEEQRASRVGPLKITILYDNYSYDPRLKTAWGFSALVETGEHTLLFDTGEDGPILLSNMRLMGVDPAQIEAVILSHIHADHVGGLQSLLGLGIQPVVYLLPSFPEAFKARVQAQTEVVEVSPGLAIDDGAFTTGELTGAIPEQALVLKREEGLVILTGCAHPGVVRIAERAQELFGGPVHLVLGGFHLRDCYAAELVDILAQFRALGVERVAPCHCTGDRAIEMFRQQYGADFLQVGVGQVILVGT